MKKIEINLLNNSGFKWYSENSIFVKGYLFNTKNVFYENSDLLNLFKDINNKEDFTNLVKSLNGCFSVIIKSKNSVYVAVDKIRAFPLFYSVTDSEIIITDNTSIFTKENSPQFLEEALIEFRAASFVSGKQTLFKNVYQVQAGEILSINDTISSYFYYKYSIGKHKDKPIDVYIEECKKVILKSFQRLLESVKDRQVVVPLSGGFDSRLIVTMLKYLGHENVICYTYGKKTTNDIPLSKKVAESLGYTWFFIEYDLTLLSYALNDTDFQQYYPYASNHSSVFYWQEFFAVKYLKENNLVEERAIFIPGHSGDFLGGSQLAKTGEIPDTFSNNNIADIILAKKYNHTKLLKKDRKLLKDKVLKTLNILADKDEGLLAYSVFEDWDFKEKLAKIIFNSSNVYSYFGYEYRFPFWDDELVDFFKYMPYTHKFNKTLYDRVLKEKFFKNFNINFENELQPGIFQLQLQKLKNKIKNQLPTIFNKYLLNRNDSFASSIIRQQMVTDLLNKNQKVEWFNNVNSILVQWYLSTLNTIRNK